MRRGRPLKAIVAAAALVAAPVATSAALPAALPGPAQVTLDSAVPAWVTAPSAASPHLSGRPAGSSVVDVSLQLPMRRQRLAEAARGPG